MTVVTSCPPLVSDLKHGDMVPWRVNESYCPIRAHVMETFDEKTSYVTSQPLLATLSLVFGILFPSILTHLELMLFGQ